MSPADGDRAVLLIPLMVLREIRLGTVARWSLCFVYFVGGISILASFLRYVFIRRYIPADDEYEAIALNETFEVWNAVEYCTASIAFCLPSLRGLWRRKPNVSPGPTSLGGLASSVSEERPPPTTEEDRESTKSHGEASSSSDLHWPVGSGIVAAATVVLAGGGRQRW